MYFQPARTLQYLYDLVNPKNDIIHPQNSSHLLLSLIPDFLTIHPCAEIIGNHFNHLNHASANQKPHQQQQPPLLLGAQDCFWEDLGAYTGEVSPLALRDLGVTIVELGHSERRTLFHETNHVTARKAAAVCKHGLIPLICVGEVTSPDTLSSESEAVVNAVGECGVQVRAVLEAIPRDAAVIFAYEPVWAIGKPVPAGVGHVSGVVAGIRRAVGESGRVGECRVLYGGSAGPGLWSEGGLGEAVDGMFLGRFAHEPEGVRKVVREVEESLGLVGN